MDQELEEIGTPTRRLTVREITSGPPDDSQEENERPKDRRVRDLRGRVKRARAVVARAPGLAEILVIDWQEAGRFCVMREISESPFRHGVSYCGFDRRRGN